MGQRVERRPSGHTGIQFVLTGSSARKLKREGVNLLAGRAFQHYLFPLTSDEIENAFSIQEILEWGTLPRVVTEANPDNRRDFLNSYVSTYLEQEIIAEQVLRNVHAFKDFLQIAAQCNGTPINYSKIARDINVNDNEARRVCIDSFKRAKKIPARGWNRPPGGGDKTLESVKLGLAYYSGKMTIVLRVPVSPVFFVKV